MPHAEFGNGAFGMIIAPPSVMKTALSAKRTNMEFHRRCGTLYSFTDIGIKSSRGQGARVGEA